MRLKYVVITVQNVFILARVKERSLPFAARKYGIVHVTLGSIAQRKLNQMRYTRYKRPQIHRHVSSKDISLLHLADQQASTHNSGGSYDMVALLAKSKPVAFGFNSLSNPAILKSSIYPEMCGMHAELDLWRQCPEDMKGGSVYVAGRATKSTNMMANTTPCVYCAAILTLAGVRHIICYSDNNVIKTAPQRLTDEIAIEGLVWR